MLGLVSQIVEARASVSQAGMGSPELVKYWGGAPNKTGIHVNKAAALGVTAYYCAVKVISESIAQLPLNLYERSEDGKSRAKVHNQIWSAVAEQPNDEQTSVEFFEYMVSCACQHGISYAEIAMQPDGSIQLWPLPPGSVKRVVTNNVVGYEFRDSINQIVYKWPAWKVLALSGFAINGISGLDLISTFATTIGLSIATQEYGAEFFGRGAQPRVVLESPHPLKPEAKENIEKTWAEKYTGQDPLSRVAVLQHGLTMKQFQVSNEQGQFLESRQFQISEFARMLRIPPHMLMDASQAKWANVEQFGTEFVVYTLGSWIRRWEQRLKMQLLIASESRMYWKFNVNALLRGDAASRASFYRQMVDGGLWTPDETRELEDMDPQPDGVGDVFYRPLNTSYVGTGAASIPQPVDNAA